MIRPNELRIGIWAINDCDDEQIQLSAEDIVTAYKDPDWLLPIELNPEWLERFGFEKDRTGYALEDKNSLSFSVTKEGKFLACWLDKSTGIIVQYVHQLQNLYFALTGEELEIKE